MMPDEKVEVTFVELKNFCVSLGVVKYTNNTTRPRHGRRFYVSKPPIYIIYIASCRIKKFREALLQFEMVRTALTE